MRKLNTLTFCFNLIVLTGLILPASLPAAQINGPELGQESAAQEPKQDPLKERQHFNKLKRTTRNIYKVTMRSTVAFRLQTALGYISTIDLPEKALKVFVGDQELFKVEVYEKQVLIKPITDESDAKTNLVIMTDSTRLAFDVSVGPPDTADFVLDFRLPQEDEALVQNAFDQKVEQKVQELQTQYQKKEEKLDQKAQEISEEKIKEKLAAGVRTIDLKKSHAEDEVQLNLLSLSQVAGKIYIRFSVLNYSKTPYRVLKTFVGIQTYEKKFLGSKEAGIIEIPSELKLAEVIKPDSYEYGVLALDYRAMGRDEKPVVRLLEDSSSLGTSKPRNLEIKGFEWFK